MTDSASDGLQITEATDLCARFRDAWGVTYQDFAAFLNGQPEQEDGANARIARYRKEGRSQAFCRTFREGYDGAFQFESIRSSFSPETSAAGYAYGQAARAHEDEFFAVEARIQDAKEARGELRTTLTPVDEARAHAYYAFAHLDVDEIAYTPRNRAIAAGHRRATAAERDEPGPA